MAKYTYSAVQTKRKAKQKAANFFALGRRKQLKSKEKSR